MRADLRLGRSRLTVTIIHPIMEMQAVLIDRAYGVRQDACGLTSRSAAAPPLGLVPPMVVDGQLNHVRSPGGSWP